MSQLKGLFPLLICCISTFHSLPALAQLPDWPGLYDVGSMPQLNVKLRESDWNTIRADETFEIVVPALFWASEDGDEEMAQLVSIRRKSATPINGKVSFKIDINEFEGDDPRAKSNWHKIKKLSLENGDDQDVVSEGLAWYLHWLATTDNVAAYPDGHTPGLANWVGLTVHIAPDCAQPCAFEFGATLDSLPQGVYLNVEQVDKQFLKNRFLWVNEETWLYKQDDIGAPELKEPGCDPEVDTSPVVAALQCAPFVGPSGKGKNKVQPADCTAGTLASLINMPVMLGTGAVNAFSSNGDELLNHEKNYFWADYSEPGDCSSLPVSVERKRTHYPWDLDAAIGDNTRNVYGQPRKQRGRTVLDQTASQRIFLQDYAGAGFDFRTQYNLQLLALTSPTTIAQAQAFLDTAEALLSAALAADPNSKVADPAAHFDGLRAWLTDRATNVRGQVCADDPLLAGCL